MICMVYTIRSFNFCLLTYPKLLIIVFILGLATKYILFKLNPEDFSVKFTFDSLASIMLIGQIGTTLMFFINKTFTNDKLKTNSFQIEEKYFGTIKSRTISVDANINGNEQHILLPNNTKEELESADSVVLTYQKGLFKIIVLQNTNIK